MVISARMSPYSPRPEPFLTADAAARARRVKMVILDADGILTDGTLVYPGFEGEPKIFSALDSVGLRLAGMAGLRLAIITGRRSDALERRAAELGIEELHQRQLWKLDAYGKVRRKYRLADAEIAFLGDDLVDLPVMRKAGFAATVPGALPEAKRIAHFVSARPGGRGGAREILDFILKVQGRWAGVAGRFL